MGLVGAQLSKWYLKKGMQKGERVRGGLGEKGVKSRCAGNTGFGGAEFG